MKKRPEMANFFLKKRCPLKVYFLEFQKQLLTLLSASSIRPVIDLGSCLLRQRFSQSQQKMLQRPFEQHSQACTTFSLSHTVKLFECCNSKFKPETETWAATILAPWFRLRLPSCRPGFKSQEHHLCFFQFELLKL